MDWVDLVHGFVYHFQRYLWWSGLIVWIQLFSLLLYHVKDIITVRELVNGVHLFYSVCLFMILLSWSMCPWLLVLIFLSSIESHFLRRMGTLGPGPRCGLNLVLSDHSVEWWYLVLDHNMDLALPWGDSTLCWVTILLNGRHLVQTTMWTSLVLVDSA